MEETHAAAEKFRLHTRALIPNYDKDFVLKHRSNSANTNRRTTEPSQSKDRKVVLVKRKDMNKVTHSYTAQYYDPIRKTTSNGFHLSARANGNFEPKGAKISRRVCEKYIQTLPLRPQSLAS
ncbi:hypothetical protein TNCV_1353291 [Trichonephila clavipes]|nr:hypothetical protein TNCV_1353291 [Trichonephila clavipes]